MGAEHKLTNPPNDWRESWAQVTISRLNQSFDKIIMIESFIHSDNTDHLIEALSECLKPGGSFILVDDHFQLYQVSQSEIQLFSEGWHAPNLLTYERLVEKLKEHDLALRTDVTLTQYMNIDREKNYTALIAEYSKENKSAEDLAEVKNQLGSYVLEKLYAENRAQYILSVFTKAE
ncbi:MAG: class I SAM-dependent methyltransferase [Lentilitoribacter sp.]